MTYNQMIEGLSIFAKYEKRGLEATFNGADHDVIWACTADVEGSDSEESSDSEHLSDRRMSATDLARLEELGWFISNEYAEAWTHYC